MAGKAYTMREMRAIVEYLTERNAYGEIKGRKMWMEYANSEKTTRTWQSLKETFIKRILPDIQNPYYKLSMDQVRSFRLGHDVAEKEKNNRLDFRTASEDSNGDNQNENEQSTTGKDKNLPTASHDDESPLANIDEELEKATGEDITSAKIISRSRSSADTVVLEYENAEDIQRALESPKNDENEGKSKSLKDLLTFEPQTPLVQELLDDFETESEPSDKEPQLNIVEHPQEIIDITESEKSNENMPVENNDLNKNFESQMEINDVDDSDHTNMNNKKEETEIATQKNTQGNNVKLQKSKSLKLKQPDNKKEEDNIDKTDAPSTKTSMLDNNVTNSDSKDITEFVTAECSDTTLQKSLNTNNKKDCNIVLVNTENSTQNTGNTSSDTILPNNQEALDDSKKANISIVTGKTKTDAEKAEINGNKSEKISNPHNSKEKKKPDKTTEKNDTSIPVIVINDTPMYNNSASVLDKNPDISDPEVIEINTDTPTSNVTEEQLNALKKVPENVVADARTKNDVSVVPIHQDKDKEVVEDKNPCLLSVSLFDEQFKNTKYSDSDSDAVAKPALKQNKSKARPQAETNRKVETDGIPQKEVEENKQPEVKENIQTIDGSSVSSADSEQQKLGIVNKTDNVNRAVNLQRERALANVFGFAHGISGSVTRKRRLSHRRRSHHRRRHHSKNDDSNSSEWTSESDSESYVSPPRGRRNRQTRKYLKPKSSRILQDPEEGTLYVKFGKNIYPLVKDGRHIKNFLVYRPDSDSDEDKSYWKQKYLEEKKRVEEAKKLLKESRETPVKDAPTSPILPSRSHNSSTANSQKKPMQNGNSKTTSFKDENKGENKDNKLVLKIAAQNGVEYCLEGGWSQISNAMPQMVKMLQSETETKSSSNEKKEEPKPEERTVEEKQSNTEDFMEVSSGASTPVVLAVDPEVHEKVNKIETEIFKEIEEREKEEQIKQNEVESINITKRKPTRLRKESSTLSITTSQSPAKRTRTSKTNSTESKQEATKPIKTKRISKTKLDVQEEQAEHKPDEIKKPRIQSKIKTTEQQSKANKHISNTKEELAKTTEKNTETTEEQTKTPEKQTKLSQIQIEENAPDPTVGTITVGKQNQIIDQKQPKLRDSLRSSNQNRIDTENSGKNSSEKVTRRQSSLRLVKTPNKYDTDSSASDIRQRPGKSKNKSTTPLLDFDDENTRYMFPPSPKRDKKSTRKNRSLPKTNLLSLHDKMSGNSLDSSQGYQDSDASPIKIILRKKKRASFTIQNKYKNRRSIRKNTTPILLQELSCDSTNSSYFVPLRRSQSSLNSEVYKTDSYQLLVPQKNRSVDKLERIDETSPAVKFDNKRHFNSITKDCDKSANENSSNILVDVGSSSIVSLPLSPEISVVENMSVSKEMIRSENHPTINELQSNISSCAMDFSEYMISNVDVSMPLMNQQCELRNSVDKQTPKNNNTECTQISDQIFNKVCTVRVENLTLSETLDQRLRDLLLESSKKTTKVNNTKENAMEVDQTENANVKKSRRHSQRKSDMEGNESKTIATKKTGLRNRKEIVMEVDESKIASAKNTIIHKQKDNATDVEDAKKVTAKKTRAKKRSSTPQKKKATEIQKVAKDLLIVEEHMESCSSAGRNSCPPVIIHLPVDDENANNCADVTLNSVKLNTRKKKDVIKVKIQRPSSRTRKRSKEASVENVSKTSNYTDSGINDTGTTSGLCVKEIDDSIDLIHNHSETCLLATECMGDSVEFVENSTSIVSLSSSETSVYSELQRLLDNAANLSGELFENCRSNSLGEQKTPEKVVESPNTEYQTPVATNSSLITEDLSDDPTQPTQWCFFSDDDDINGPTVSDSNVGTFGSNLKHIFPITCAVPDLSTISEMSKENEDSRKPNFDTNGGIESCDLQNLY